MPESAPSLNDVFQEELARLIRALVQVRVAKAPWALLLLAGIVIVDPRPLRVALGGLSGLGLLALSYFERERFQKDGYSPRFIAQNASAMAVFHLLLFLMTGSLTSPLLPLLLVFTLTASILLGEDPSGRVFVYLQLGVVGILYAVQALGGAPALAPDWLAADLGGAHTAAVALFLALAAGGAARMGRRSRRLFELALANASRARDDLLATQRLQSEELTALSGTIAHELKNPLATVKGLAALLARDLDSGKPAERLSVLRQEVDRMQGVLEEFLNFSRPPLPLATEEVDVRWMCAEVVTLHEGLTRDRQVRLTLSGEGTARIDARKTRQVLINLVQNALDASPPGGSVHLSLTSTPEGLAVHVDDEGSGLDPAVADKVFDAGVTTKARGTGIGLTIARALARQQGGDLTLVNRPPHGCQATLTLPWGSS